MADLLIEHRTATAVGTVLLLVLGPVAARLLVGRRRLAGTLAGVALVPVLAATLAPVDRELFARCVTGWTLPTPARTELWGNVLLTVVPALLATVASRRPGHVILAGGALAAGVETLQALVPAIGRSCDTNDWLANTIGVALGACLASAGTLRRR